MFVETDKSRPLLGRVTTKDDVPFCLRHWLGSALPSSPGQQVLQLAVCSLLCSVELKRWHLIAGKIDTPPRHATDKKFQFIKYK